MYRNMALIVVIIINIIKGMLFHPMYGKKKGDFIAMSIILIAIPLLFLDSKIGFLSWLIAILVCMNWIYTYYVLKVRK